ncbi:hypothetical protein BJN34_00175 [Cupriavidus necator]|uniref:Uncharacterized protein n=1 Tax=Cupriavidus necator TaxID=106590 RepID=A0A1U9UIA0_CUPNE|nr:hypothetical protein [Cupriavidus necator]AQV92308.1 hypothetical protein BJN34_00175 [Cupriavidus necator]
MTLNKPIAPIEVINDLDGTGTVTIKAGEATLAGADVDGVSGTGVNVANLTLRDSRLQSSGAAVAIDATERYAQADSDVLAAGDVRLHAGTVAIDSGARQSTLIAKGGGVLVQADGDLTNSGGLIQGQIRIVDEPLSAGAVTVRAGGTVLNTSMPDHLGILFGAADDVVVRAGGDVVNRYARMLSNGRLDVEARGNVVNAITKTDGLNGGTPNIANVFLLERPRTLQDIDSSGSDEEPPTSPMDREDWMPRCGVSQNEDVILAPFPQLWICSGILLGACCLRPDDRDDPVDCRSHSTKHGSPTHPDPGGG